MQSSRIYPVSNTRTIPQSKWEEKCNHLLREPQIRFAGIIDHMGNLIAGGLGTGLSSLEDEADRRKLYMELILRVTTRQEFDQSLGEVDYSASRRKKALMLSFPLDNKVLLVSAEPTLGIDDTAKKIKEIVGLS